MSAPPTQFAGPGFIAAIIDVPFPIAVPNGAYFAYDPVSTVGAVEVALREGSRAFFRSVPITGPTSFQDLQAAAAQQTRPSENRDYLIVSELTGGSRKATLNIHTGETGGYAECKYFSQISVTFLVDDIRRLNEEGYVLDRTFGILNPFLDKYRLLNEDYRISRVSRERNYYFATCHTSPLAADELSLRPAELFQRLANPRTFYSDLGHGGSNIVRTNSFELLGPRSPLSGQILDFFKTFIQEEYEIPLSYDLILEAIADLQRFREYRLAIVHAETALEVYVVDRLLKLMVGSGISATQASHLIENDRAYWGVKAKVRQLDQWTQQYCAANGLAFNPFVASALYTEWESDLYRKRNSAVHAGANTFSYDEASVAIARAKECIVFLESRIPQIADRIQLSPTMNNFRQNAGEVMF